MEDHSSCKVCVTGGSGYIGSALVKQLLEKGYDVHTTLRNLDDETKIGLLRSFPNAESRLCLFKADIYNPQEFEQAIEGCEFVFHVAAPAPMQHSEGNTTYNSIEAAVNGVEKISSLCIQSKTVRRLIYTSSAVVASPLEEDMISYKNFIDETCWTPLHLNLACGNQYDHDYTESKVLAEKEILRIGDECNGKLEVVALGVGLVGGDTNISRTPGSVVVLISQVMNNVNVLKSLRFLEELLGKVPVVHVQDVCRALIFCMETPSMKGRFLCASSFVGTSEIAEYFMKNYPEFCLSQEFLEGSKREIIWGSKKLEERGFEYKYDMKMILDDSIKCARKTGYLKL